MQVENWGDVRFFLAVHREGSLTAAARALSVDQTTVTRRLRSLENSCGQPLFERLRGGPLLTSFGDQMVVTAERIEAELLDLEARMLGGQSHMEGSVRLTTPAILAVELVEDARDFAAAFPGIQLELIGSDQDRDISKREADIALRLAGSRSKRGNDLVGRRPCGIAQAVYGVPAMLDVPWEDRQWLGRVDSLAGWSIIDTYRERFGGGRWAFRTNDAFSVVEAARAGAGVTVLTCGCPRLTRGLIALTEPEPIGDMWLLTHPELLRNPRIRATIDHWYEVLKRRGPAFSGEVMQNE